MPINLVKGQNHVLNMNIFHVGLGWDVNEDASSDDDFDLDVSRSEEHTSELQSH